MTRKRLSAKWTALTTAGLLVIGGAAFAYWSQSGSGTGTAGTSTPQSVKVIQTNTVAGLAPGLGAQPLSGNFDNPNSGPVYVTAVTAAVTGTDKAGCTTSDFTIAGTATVNAEIPSGSGVGSWSGLTIQFNNTNVNQDACKNAALTITYTAS